MGNKALSSTKSGTLEISGPTNAFKNPFPFYRSEEIAGVKKTLNIDQEKLKEAFERLEKVLDTELPKLSTEVIPVVNFEDLAENDNQFNAETVEKIKKYGVVLVRNVIEKEDTKNLLDDVEKYMNENGQDPQTKGTTFFNIYWSKPQLKVRHHTNMVKVQNALLKLWSKCEGLDDTVNLNQPLTYNDRLRFRKPNDSMKLGPHWDSGSLQRWSDSDYKEVYRDVFNGDWESFDPFCVKGRGLAKMDEHCSFFRAFQGWTSLSTSGPGDGTLRVLPLLKEVLAYVMMRPLLDDIPDNMIPGYQPKKLFYLVPQVHKKLMDAMISIPKVNPGDTVWWHCDTIHSVEELHSGKETNTVLYIPVGPDCPSNRDYLEKAKQCFLDGKCPPDFGMSNVQCESDFQDRATLDDLNDDAKVMMGFD